MNRQDFLNYMGLAAGGGLVSACFQACKASTTNQTVNFTLDLNSAANAALRTPGGSVVANGVIVAKTSSGGYTALAAACTHEGATVNYSGNGNQFICPRHGAQFSASGAVLKGPARTPLTQYKTELRGNSLKVYSLS
ncbi:MAG: ubiquinol-cytochrome c reductase iron-sulfur subunit [Nodosilinea sp.]|jgi:cytochrome b6-f complex iron-sulfur subunit